MQFTGAPITEAELMAHALRTLQKTKRDIGFVRFNQPLPADPERRLTPEQTTRRTRSLQTCHRPSLYERPRHAAPKESGAYVPAAAARIENDRNLTDGARRCARKILELTYRKDRSSRTLQVNVSYLARALHRSGRTIQRYLGQLEREGYLRTEIVIGHRSRMCVGLIVHLLAPLFPPHHRDKWPETRGNPDATQSSENEISYFFKSYNPRFRRLHDPSAPRCSRWNWTERCRDGVFRALLKTIPPMPAIHLPSGGAGGQAPA